MIVIAINGSPRKNGNTAILLKKALEGAASQGAVTEFIQLSGLKMKGCQGCFSCKKRGGKSYGKCALKDDMTPMYKKIEQAGALFLGSPFYFHSMTSEMRMFIERLYPYFSYEDFTSKFPRKINVGLIYTMGADDQDMEKWYRKYIKMNQNIISATIGPAETLVSTDTLHVVDYTKIVADMLEPWVERKLNHNREIFPRDCQTAFEMGARFAKQSATE
ncbi:MAG: flavodoxin family protein [Dehalococcoidia bacterium]|nr:flavodoxin family protein [Dehalococcoidia bacterium]